METNLSNTNNAVWLAYETSAERDVVLKFVKNRKAAIRERILMVDIDHPNVAKLLTTFSHANCTVLVLEYKKGLNLLQLWEKLDKKSGLAILIEIASALNAIHARGLWHGDVSHLNVIYSEEKKQAWLVDFSFEGKCAPGFHAPEDFEDCDHKVNHKTDIFRFGILIHLLRPDLKSKFQDCLHSNPNDRPTIDQVLLKLQKQKASGKVRTLALTAMVIAGISIYPLWNWEHHQKPASQPAPIKTAANIPKTPTHTRLLASYSTPDSSMRPAQTQPPGRILHILADEP